MIRTVLPADLPVPQDDGAAQHLAGLKLPSVTLAATDGSQVDLSALAGRTVVYVYPRTGVPGKAVAGRLGPIPGARGCTPQSCSFRDHFAELKQLGVDASSSACRPRTPPISARRPNACICRFRCCRTSELALARAIWLPTFAVAGMTLLKRMALVIDDGAGHQGVLSGLSAGQERRGGDCLAATAVASERAVTAPRVTERPDRRARRRTRRGTSPASARRYWCCSASSDSWRNPQRAELVRGAVPERRGRAACAERGQRAVMRDPAERDDRAQIVHLGDGCGQETNGRS